MHHSVKMSIHCCELLKWQTMKILLNNTHAQSLIWALWKTGTKVRLRNCQMWYRNFLHGILRNVENTAQTFKRYMKCMFSICQPVLTSRVPVQPLDIKTTVTDIWPLTDFAYAMSFLIPLIVLTILLFTCSNTDLSLWKRDVLYSIPSGISPVSF